MKIIGRLAGLLFGLILTNSIYAQGTAFTYQGQLNDGGNPATGYYDLTFSLYGSTSLPGTVISTPVTNSATAVANGLFTVTLDFGPAVFAGSNYWLQIGVRTNGSAASFTVLSPRQPVLPVPYAIFANSASNLLGTLAASAFVGYTNTVALTNSANVFGGDGAALTALNASQLASGTMADGRLSTNVALLNANQTFSGNSAFTNFGNSFRGSFFGNGLVGWLIPTGTTVQAAVDTGYLLTNNLQVTVKLPTSPNPGDIVRISGAGAGGWSVFQNSNQVVIGNFSGFTNSSWQQSSIGTANWSSIAASADGVKMVAAANGSGQLYNSVNSGKTWTSTAPFSGAWQAVASSADGIKLVAALNGGVIYTSTNSGASWVPGLGPAAFSSVASSADGTRIVAVINNNSTGGVGIYASTDSGATWIQQSSAARFWFSVASSANGSNLVAVVAGGTGAGIYTNSGNTWTATSAPSKTWVSVASSADGIKLAAVESGTGQIYTSVNRGSTWTQQTNAPSLTWASIASSADGGKLVAASKGGGIYSSINFGVTWTQQPGTTNKNWNCIAASADGGTLAAGVFNAGLYYAQATLQTGTTPGTSGGISGTQGSAVELQYIGNNQFMPVSSAGTIWAN